MATLIDSEAQFAQRTLDLRFSEDLKRSFRRNGLTTFGTYAYAHGQPGQQIVDDSFEAWFTTNVLQGASLADIAGAKKTSVRKPDYGPSKPSRSSSYG